MISKQNILPATPMGATLVTGGGATFRAWAPRASAVYVNGIFGGVPHIGPTDDLLLSKDANGYWAGFVETAKEGDLYHFCVAGTGSSGYKRDPYARELYATLYALDQMDRLEIFIEAPPATSEWEAVWDRLEKAAGA